MLLLSRRARGQMQPLPEGCGGVMPPRFRNARGTPIHSIVMGLPLAMNNTAIRTDSVRFAPRSKHAYDGLTLPWEGSATPDSCSRCS